MPTKNDTQWVQVQEAVYTSWLNSLLPQDTPKIMNVKTDLTPEILKVVAERLTQKELSQKLTNKVGRIYSLNDYSTVLSHLQENGIDTSSCSSENLVDGGEGYKNVLGMLFSLYRMFCVKNYERNHKGTYEGKKHQKLEDFVLGWINEKVAPYGLRVNKLGEDIKDGNVLLALSEAFSGDKFYEQMKEKSPVEKIEQAFNVAQDKIGVQKIFVPEDLINGDVDERALMLYLTLFNRNDKMEQSERMKEDEKNKEKEKLKEEEMKAKEKMWKDKLETMEKQNDMLRTLQANQEQVLNEEIKKQQEIAQKALDEKKRLEDLNKTQQEKYTALEKTTQELLSPRQQNIIPQNIQQQLPQSNQQVYEQQIKEQSLQQLHVPGLVQQQPSPLLTQNVEQQVFHDTIPPKQYLNTQQNIPMTQQEQQQHMQPIVPLQVQQQNFQQEAIQQHPQINCQNEQQDPTQYQQQTQFQPQIPQQNIQQQQFMTPQDVLYQQNTPMKQQPLMQQCGMPQMVGVQPQPAMGPLGVGAQMYGVPIGQQIPQGVPVGVVGYGVQQQPVGVGLVGVYQTQQTGNIFPPGHDYYGQTFY
ncbi:hypothetical protein EIN_486780 [Entamoeba invadens IP1]|uniref:Calponin-homology (CH) domain-containing protein n=1 Tax=Entamoeba invadens IP1 TaxID=370355 RepID=A0A0A1U4N6_ENTIV|nr:hypothetical protein EIN_486780 [Entamoeba invadens IP1]ELP89216.1 hypothetical protein EIN_486780 [Entamoeba invadens IP1]|eukprot:XP_004255987.1 hypothetical protein EIN_486780 [Entamoeba invadens IP1]